MEHLPDCYGIIPARYASSRFPGKPLADILGKPMLWHVYRQACRCEQLTRVVLATDDERIAAAAESLNVPVVMTRSDHPSGTDRVLEAAEQLQVPADAVVVNIQGDQPVMAPQMLGQLVAPFARSDTRVTTLVRKAAPADVAGADAVTVTFSRTGRALYFSRSVIPFARDGAGGAVYQHVGMYAFRMEALQTFVALGPSPLEKTERLEQLRLLENDIAIHVVVTEHVSADVDRPEDIAAVARLLKEQSSADAGGSERR
jgi:3-deoxy-manno-octulosonate cytidylyltransferase (CMP-KDO synthetase)